MIIAVLGWRNIGQPNLLARSSVVPAGPVSCCACAMRTVSDRVGNDVLAAHGPGLARMSFVKMSGSRARVKVACRTRTAVGAGGFRTERKAIIYTSMFKRVLPFRNFQYIILTSVCYLRVRIRLGFCHEIPSVGKDFLGGAGNVGNLKAYTEKYMIGKRERIEKGRRSEASPFSFIWSGPSEFLDPDVAVPARRRRGPAGRCSLRGSVAAAVQQQVVGFRPFYPC